MHKITRTDCPKQNLTQRYLHIMIVAILPGQAVDNITLHNITCITYTQYYPDRLSATLPAYYVHTITYTDCQQQLFQLLLRTFPF